MGYQELHSNLPGLIRKVRRTLLNGPPNSRKTGSLYTAHSPVIVQSYPGEKGVASIPSRTEDGVPVKSFAWETIDVSQPQNWNAIWEETRKLTIEILAGKHGPCTTFVGDGLHKLYQIVLASKCDGANMSGDEFEPKLYSKAHAEFWGYIDLVLSSQVEHIIMTCWDGAEKDNALDDSKESNKRRHIWPELPGQAAKKVMGEFSLVLYAGQEGVGQAGRYFWQTRPQGYVWGAGLKVPRDIIDKINIPREVEQHWKKLDTLLVSEITKAFQPSASQGGTVVAKPGALIAEEGRS